MIYLESMGSPVPGETGVIAASLLAAKGELSIVALYFAVLFGAILGDFTGYLIGRFGGSALLRKVRALYRADVGQAEDDRGHASPRAGSGSSLSRASFRCCAR